MRFCLWTVLLGGLIVVGACAQQSPATQDELLSGGPASLDSGPVLRREHLAHIDHERWKTELYLEQIAAERR